MMNKFTPSLIPLLGLLTITVLAIALISFFNPVINSKRKANQANDSAEYSINIGSLLGNDWHDAPILYIDEQEDLSGWHEAIAGSTEWSARRENSNDHFRYRVITYFDEQVAQQRYLQQNNWIFVLSFGVPVSRQRFSYEALSIPAELRANYAGAACKYINADTQCTALLLYENHLVVVDLWQTGVNRHQIQNYYINKIILLDSIWQDWT